MDRNTRESLPQISSVWGREIEIRLFDVIRDSVTFPSGTMFLTTVDLHSDLFYAPVSTLDLKSLQSVILQDAGSLLDLIRDKFPISLSKAGFVATIYGTLEESKTNDYFLVLHIDDAGKVVKAQRLYSNGTLKSVKQSTNAVINTHPGLDPNINRLIDELRSETQISGQKYFFLKPDYRVTEKENSGVRGLELLQVGFFLTEEKIEVIADALFQAARTSSFATLTLFYEKERYYQKALRQAVKGSIIKYGEIRDIQQQLEILRELNKTNGHSVPRIEREDPDLTNSPSEADRDVAFAWYRMPRFTLSSLLDVLSFTSGLRDYEVSSLVRSSFAHMKSIYWGPSLEPMSSTKTRAYLSAGLALAIYHSGSACENILSKIERIKAGIPIKLERGIDVFDPKEVTDSVQGMRWIFNSMDQNHETDFEINLLWGKYKSKTNCSNVTKELTKISKALAKLDEKDKIESPFIRGRSHGDAHFGNFLIDASVPEDPLVISIDPKEIAFDPEYILKLHEPIGEICSKNEFELAIKNVAYDPAYDVAKLMLSCSCAYGLAYRYAFQASATSGRILRLKQVRSDVVNKLSDLGGISGSQIVTIDAPVTNEAWRYLFVAAEVSLRDYSDVLSKFVGNDVKNTTVGLIQLWLITVRHAFSICEILFPKNVERAITMYLLSMRFVSRGVNTISEILLNGLEDELSIERLLTLFTSDIFNATE